MTPVLAVVIVSTCFSIFEMYTLLATSSVFFFSTKNRKKIEKSVGSSAEILEQR